MAKQLGKNGSVSVGGVNVACVTSWSLSEEADTLETTCMDGSGAKSYIGSLTSFSGSVECNMDAGDVGQDAFTVGSTVSLSLSTGDVTYSGDAVITSKSVDAATADLITIAFDFQGTGSLTVA